MVGSGLHSCGSPLARTAAAQAIRLGPELTCGNRNSKGQENETIENNAGAVTRCRSIMSRDSVKGHAALRKGRFSTADADYFLTACTAGKCAGLTLSSGVLELVP